MTEAGRDLKEDYQWQIASQYRGDPLLERLRINAEMYFGTKRRRDLDNACKHVLDACTGYLWDDDSQIDELHVYRRYDPSNPRIELTITIM